MSYRSNPYKVGDWVGGQDFYGRKALLEQLLWQSNRVTHLLGMRRIGKTSILKEFAARWGRAVYYNLQRTGSNWDEFNKTLQRAIKSEAKRFPWLTDDKAIQNSGNVIELLENFDAAAHAAGAQVWLLMDETELLIELGRKNIDVLQMFRSVIGELRAVQVVFASAKELTELDELTTVGWRGSPFLNHFPPPIYITHLEDEAAAALIRQAQNDIPLAVTDEVVQAICRCTNCHPYFIQWLCFHLWMQNPDPGAWRVGDVVCPSSPQLHHILKKDFEYLSDPEREIIRAVLIQQPLPSFHRLYIQGLTALGYLRQLKTGYEIGNDFFKNWLLDLENQDWTTASKIAAESTLRLYEKAEKPSE